MKFLPSQLAYFLHSGSSRRNLRVLWRFVLILVVLVAAYSIVFHFIMAAEGQDHSWVTGIYWTLTVMSTLGFGDITFQSDAGRAFSILVLLSGIIFLLVVLPFTFIQFFYAPWLKAQSEARAPRRVPEDARGHVILTDYDAIAISLISRLTSHGRRYHLLEPELSRALDLNDQGISVVVGAVDDAESYRRMRVDDASLVVSSRDDLVNTNIVSTVREITDDVPIVSFARDEESVDVMELAGATRVLHLTELLGQSLARRTLGGDVRANVIGRFDDLLIVEAPVTGTPMAGRPLAEGWLRQATGLNVVGLWTRGRFDLPRPEVEVEPSTVLVMAGSDEQVARFAELTAIYSMADAPALVLGGGRVGRAAARALARRGVPYRIVERNPEHVRDPEHTIVGNAADLATLERAGIRDSPTAIVTTADDATNIYLTIYCRKLRSQMQIISRATLERNVATLHRAGADFVMSYASMGASAAFNALERGDVVMIAEGLDVFRVPVPRSLAGTPLRDSRIRETTGCSVVAFDEDGRTATNPRAEQEIPTAPGAELILVGTTESEREFVRRFGA